MQCAYIVPSSCRLIFLPPDAGPGPRRLSLGQSPPDYGSPPHNSKLWKRYSAPFGDLEAQPPASLSPLLHQSHATATLRGRQLSNRKSSPLSPSTAPLKKPGHTEPKSSPQEVLRDRNRRSRNPPAAEFNWSPDYALKRQKQGESRAAAPERHNIITGIPLNSILTQQQDKRSNSPGSESAGHYLTRLRVPQQATDSKAPFLNMRQRHKRVATKSILAHAHGSRAYHTSSSAQPTGFYSTSSTLFGSVSQGGVGPAAMRYSKHSSVGTGPAVSGCAQTTEEDFGSQRVPLLKAGKTVTFASG